MDITSTPVTNTVHEAATLVLAWRGGTLHLSSGACREFGGRAFEQDMARSVNDCADVAPWLPPGVEPDEAALADGRATVRGGRHF
jgi:hypothetical protein